jgi:hypothetical protein
VCAAERLGLPLVPPFLARTDDGGVSRGGAKFAVGGATAINASFFHRDDPPGGSTFPLNTSLSVQLRWFESAKPSLCGNTNKQGQFFFLDEEQRKQGTRRS